MLEFLNLVSTVQIVTSKFLPNVFESQRWKDLSKEEQELFGEVFGEKAA